MFGADTSLVMDALQMAGISAVIGGGAVWLLIRRGKKASDAPPKAEAGSLEDRVRVLERIATDRSQDLADEIDALRESTPAKQDTRTPA